MLWEKQAQVFRPSAGERPEESLEEAILGGFCVVVVVDAGLSLEKFAELLLLG